MVNCWKACEKGWRQHLAPNDDEIYGKKTGVDR
jgi:hypothetical protein